MPLMFTISSILFFFWGHWLQGFDDHFSGGIGPVCFKYVGVAAFTDDHPTNGIGASIILRRDGEYVAGD